MDMAVGQMVDQLSDLPSSRAVGFLKILGLKSLDLGFQLSGKRSYFSVSDLISSGLSSVYPLETSDGIL
jgi:hypothetical protein